MRTLLLLTAAVIAVVAGIAALKWSNNNVVPAAPDVAAPSSANAPDVTAIDVLVARNDIPVGTLITADMVDKQPWPKQLVLEGFVTGDIKDAGVVGKVTRGAIMARQPILMNQLADANQPGFLAAVLGKGMRAMTLATDAVTGIAGYVFPGDRVDILFVHNLAGQGSGAAVSEVLAPNVRVLAINVRDANVGDALASVVTGASGAPSTITVEVSEEMAQKLRLAEKVGSLSLALRSINDQKDEHIEDPSHLSSLSRDHTGGSGDAVIIIRGVGDAKEPAPVAAPSAGVGGLLGSILGR